MEELQSTEVLDREILEDARRKAQRILKSADETVGAGTKRWDRKTDRAIAALKTRYAERLEASRNEIMARLPLDKRRIRLAKIEGFLEDAAAAYLSALSRKQLLSILEQGLKTRAEELASPGGQREKIPPAGRAAARGLSGKELGTLLKKAFPKNVWEIEKGEKLISAPGTFPAVVADTGEARITVSADAVMKTLLQDKRAELSAALLGEGVLDA